MSLVLLHRHVSLRVCDVASSFFSSVVVDPRCGLLYAYLLISSSFVHGQLRLMNHVCLALVQYIKASYGHMHIDHMRAFCINSCIIRVRTLGPGQLASSQQASCLQVSEYSFYFIFLKSFSNASYDLTPNGYIYQYTWGQILHWCLLVGPGRVRVMDISYFQLIDEISRTCGHILPLIIKLLPKK